MGTIVALTLLWLIFIFFFGVIVAAIVATFFETKIGKITASMIIMGFGVCLVLGVFV